MPHASPPCPESYRNLRYRVRVGGRYVAGVNQATGLLCTIGGGERASTPGRPLHRPPLVLERGLSRDDGFLTWAAALSAQPAARAEHPAAPRLDVELELCNERGRLVVTYLVRRCWPVACETVAVVGVDETLALIDRLVLDHEGFERDVDLGRAAVG